MNDIHYWEIKMAKTCISTLFAEFSEWLEDRGKLFSSNLVSIKKALSRGWYFPKPDLKLSDLGAERFPIKESLETYQKTLQGEGLSADVAATRIQASSLKACDRAFHLRHTTVPRLLAHGYTENAIETNNLYSTTMKELVSSLIREANKSREEREV